MERIRGITEKSLPLTLTIVKEELEPVEFTEKDYEEAVQRLKQHYPQIGRRVYKSRKKSWKQVFDEMYDIIKKLEKLESKTSK
jgi:hypothetical protein